MVQILRIARIPVVRVLLLLLLLKHRRNPYDNCFFLTRLLTAKGLSGGLPDTVHKLFLSILCEHKFCILPTEVRVKKVSLGGFGKYSKGGQGGFCLIFFGETFSGISLRDYLNESPTDLYQYGDIRTHSRCSG
jgi:hypothetical protein